ncbi:MAG: glutamine-hydrolyzing GMP synthase, partial [Syntrophomonadaceae bacterium]|nr:glutamine-hydrolyzing GMP synthase [Syntrophomonadaceae bacterium]
MEKELVLVLDFGGQYNQLIARRVRELSVFCEMVPYDISFAEMEARKPKGIILTGGPASVHGEDAPLCDPRIFSMGVPVLGICYGMQLLARQLGGMVKSSQLREYGRTRLEVSHHSLLFKGISSPTQVWMSHGDSIESVPEGFQIDAATGNCPIAAFSHAEKKIYGVQFHPEVKHTLEGTKVLRNFLFEICGLKGDWDLSDFINEKVEEIR